MRLAGKYIAAKKPDRVVCLGDFYDMESLSSYDRGKKSFEGRRYRYDIAAGNMALDLLMEPIIAAKEESFERGEDWDCSFDVTLGNHEQRIERAVEEQPELEGVIGYHNFSFEKWGWTVHDFLKVVVIDGVSVAHYMVSGAMLRPIGTARAILTKKHTSCLVGHAQKYDIAVDHDATGKRLTAIMCGTYNRNHESYLGYQGNPMSYRGLQSLYNVRDGEFSSVAVDLEYLERKYGDQ
jgi:hypothetical protein